MAEIKFDIVKLCFTSPLHLSRGQTDFYDKSETTLHSDTIKSAIFSCAKQLYKDDISKIFFDSFIISSAFPFYKNEYFLPKLLIDFKINIKGIEEGPKKNKKLKKIEYLSIKYFEDVINNTGINVAKEQISENGKFLKAGTDNFTIFKSEVQQRLVMPKDDETHPKPYYVDRLFFDKNAGLYFLVEFKDNEFKEKIKTSLKLLSSQGFGTDRNVGNGQFDFDLFEKELTIQVPDKPTHRTNLSIYLPDGKEVENELLKNSRYQLQKRGGYISSPENEDFITFRKKSIYMFNEGSVFNNIDIKGKIEDLKPEGIDGLNHPIWRDGTTITIPVKNI